MAVNLAKRFIRQISQPFDHTQTGISLWTLEDILERQRQEKEEEAREEAAAAEIGLAPSAPTAPPQDEDYEMGGLDDDELLNMPMPMEVA
jgi:DNA excision repair protein ERCC-2